MNKHTLLGPHAQGCCQKAEVFTVYIFTILVYLKKLNLDANAD